ncbi:TIGR01777 family oxidoreductase [Desertivirga xinjiangensis]|uniref:TIGR01777 family oxidoreductase n=1 Tax=Desertivirga xinjiangensis TaxID=539206 RepID=UPI00210CDB58|nr:TIGR01777 family oxidoreductase [Pedobacter xinjiangensis]
MKYRKIILAGGNGYLGGVLARFYKDLAEEVIILSRKPAPRDKNVTTLLWDGRSKGDWVDSLNGADLLLNLCGKNVNCRYTEKNRKEIYSSRLVPTALFGEVVAELDNPPELWINITSATIYRHAEDRPQDEENGEMGYGFSVDVCQKWEKIFFKTTTPRTRKIALRMGIVLGNKDGAFPRLLNLVNLGLGGKQGDGGQYVSWVHEQDAARCTQWLMDHKELSGVFNCTAPGPVKNAEFMTAIRKARGIPFGLNAPAWLLGAGAVLIGTETELILKSRWVLPTRLTESGYTFLFPEIAPAVHDILSTTL